MKRMLCAGLLSAAVTVATSIAVTPAPVQAADLYGSLKDTPRSFSPRASHAGPCYFRADVGASISRGPQTSWPVYNESFGGVDNDLDGVVDQDEVNYDFAGDEVSEVDLENTWLADIGAGCGSGSRGVRGELTFGFRGERELKGIPQIYNGTIVGQPIGTPNPPVDDPIHTSLKSYALMFNTYYDLGQWSGFVPYVGAGVGMAYHVMDEVYFTENPNLVNRIQGNRDIAFAWSLMAGFGYQISDRAILDVGYRYLNMGKATSGRVDSANFVNPRVTLDDIAAHEVKVGLRYHLNGWNH